MADYTIDIYANDKTSGALSSISNKLGRLESNSRRVGGALKGALAAGAAFATGAVVSGIVGQYTEYERYNTVLQTYLGSQEKATAEMQRLQGLANSLPQNLQDVTEAFVVLQSRGIDTSSKAITAFSNIATANGKSMTQLAEAIADGLTGEFERLKEFGIKVSKENDQFVADIGNGQKIIANSSQELMTELQKLGEEGGKFGGAAEANAGTLSQAFSNLQGAIFETSIAFGDGAKGGMIQFTEAITALVRDNKELITNIGKLVGEGLAMLPGAFVAVSDAVKPLQPLMSLVGTVIQDLLWPMLKNLFIILGEVAKTLTPFIEAILPPLVDLFGWVAEKVISFVNAMKPVYEVAGPAMVSVLEGIADIAQTVYDGFMSLVNGMVAVYDKAIELKNGVTGAFGNMKDGVLNAADDTWNGVKNGAYGMYDYIVGNSVVPDMVKEVIQEFVKMKTQSLNHTDQWTAGVMSASDNMALHVTQRSNQMATSAANAGASIQEDFVNTFVSALDDGKLELNDFSSFFGGLMKNLVKEALMGGNGISSAFSGLGSLFGGGGGGGGLLGGLFGGGGGGLFGGISSIFSGLFGGFFADGGYLGAGKIGIAGEAGAELITGPARITPLDDMNGGVAPNVNINIHAIDTQSGTEFLLKNKAQIEGIIHRSYSKRGKTGIYN